MSNVFTAIQCIEIPEHITAAAAGSLDRIAIRIHSDGSIPFPQLIIRHPGGGEALLIRDDGITNPEPGLYVAAIPAGILREGVYSVQAEGCKTADLARARPEDWVKAFAELRVSPAPAPEQRGGAAGVGSVGEKKLYFGIHKHMHQPYYRAADPGFWDGQNDEIFASRAGAYRHFINMAAAQYQALPAAALSMSWSGSLVEQLNRTSAEGLAHGAYAGDWKAELRQAASLHDKDGYPRADFSAFGYYHPLMPLIPHRDIVAQIRMHRETVRREFGVEPAAIVFPPETAFHVRIIPALLEAGMAGVIYDSIHRYRSCRGYPYAGKEEGMLPPNPAEQENPAVRDWLQLRNVWAGSKISPSLLRPEFVGYTDQNGKTWRIAAVPAERYIGNEDARGGFGALQYPDVLGQVLKAIEETGSYDPAHPPFFLLHSDGDNYGGGTDSYYGSNTGAMVEWLRRDGRFELIGISEYLNRFPPDPDKTVHIEPGSWSGADNGDPQFMKWFSGYNRDYSPDLNSWAVLTALQNAVHTMLDLCPGDGGARAAERLLLTAEASDYWYWTGQDVWDSQVTAAANAALGIIGNGVEAVTAAGRDATGPTIFPPWVTPENPGGQTWGNNCLVDADRQGVVHTFIYDVSGLRWARLIYRGDAGAGPERELPLADRGPYPSRTSPARTANLYEAELPVGAGDIRYWIEAEDNRGNVTNGSLERIFLA